MLEGRVPVTPERRLVLDALVRTTRSVMSSVATTKAEADVVEQATGLLREADALLSSARGERVHRDPLTADWRERARAGQPVAMAELNPMRFPLSLVVDGPRATCTMTPTAIHEGPPGLFHGGWSAAVLDHVLGILISAEGLPAFTARLDLSFRAPVDLDVPITIEAEVLGREGRKVMTVARILQRDRVCIHADGLFVTPEHLLGRGTS